MAKKPQKSTRGKNPTQKVKRGGSELSGSTQKNRLQQTQRNRSLESGERAREFGEFESGPRYDDRGRITSRLGGRQETESQTGLRKESYSGKPTSPWGGRDEEEEKGRHFPRRQQEAVRGESEEEEDRSRKSGDEKDEYFQGQISSRWHREEEDEKGPFTRSQEGLKDEGGPLESGEKQRPRGKKSTRAKGRGKHR